eukprot:1398558-Rhodomonas_salina.1
MIRHRCIRVPDCQVISHCHITGWYRQILSPNRPTSRHITPDCNIIPHCRMAYAATSSHPATSSHTPPLHPMTTAP